MRYYEAPTAKQVNFEVVDVLMASTATPEVLVTWGSSIREVDTSTSILYK